MRGRIFADLTLRRSGATAAAEGHLSLDHYALDLPTARGQVSGKFDFAGTGQSPATLVAGLAGSGTLNVSDLLLMRSDPAAIVQTLGDVEEDRLSIDETEIDRALSAAFDQHALSVASATFDAGLAAGVLRLTGKGTTPATGHSGVTQQTQASLDLRTFALDQSSVLTLTKLPRNWNDVSPQVGLEWTGPFESPVRNIDATSFVNALAARAIARETARIEAQEFDVHEHAVALARLESGAPAGGGSFTGDRGRQARGLARPRPRRHARTLEAIAGDGKTEGGGKGGKDATSGDHASAPGDAKRATGGRTQHAAAHAGRSERRRALLMPLLHRQFCASRRPLVDESIYRQTVEGRANLCLSRGRSLEAIAWNRSGAVRYLLEWAPCFQLAPSEAVALASLRLIADPRCDWRASLRVLIALPILPSAHVLSARRVRGWMSSRSDKDRRSQLWAWRQRVVAIVGIKRHRRSEGDGHW